jgi:transposase
MTTKKKSSKLAAPLPVIRPNVAGIDIGSREHLVGGPVREDGSPNVRAFGTTTDSLRHLVDWLVAQGVQSVAMESTSVYWIPVYELLEEHGIEAVLINARQLHNVPGRKTDIADCQWMQILHSCGLLRGSFRPGDAIVRLRALRRQMANLIEERSRHVQWMQKALDPMNVKVHHAVSDLTGETGLAIVRAIVAGERDPSVLARLRDKRCRKSEREIAEHLTGTWREEHLFVLGSSLRMFDVLEKEIAHFEQSLLAEMAALQPPERREQEVPRHPNPRKEKSICTRGDQPARTALWRFAGHDLTRIDGISVGTAKVILTEVGTTLDSFPTEHHFVSWLRLCPRTPISGGKPLKKRRNSFGASRVAASLRMAALTLGRSRTALGAAFRRLARRKDKAIAVFATARKLGQLVYRMLRYGADYVDRGETDYELALKIRRIIAITSEAAALGFTLQPKDSEPTALQQ